MTEMNILRAHWLPVAPLAVFGVAEVGAAAGATPMHFAAIGATITALVAVVKGWEWVKKTLAEQITAAFTMHNALDDERHKRLEDRISSLTDKLDERPCAAKCNH